ncbi:MAG TPA: hypothetical protein VD998_03010 [Verrucomicrobiae bacterium]|nr:hypothetical protein [Verrucomicrobiae bacterium]
MNLNEKERLGRKLQFEIPIQTKMWALKRENVEYEREREPNVQIIPITAFLQIAA